MEDTSLEDFIDAGDGSSEAASERAETDSDTDDASSETEPEPLESESDGADAPSKGESEPPETEPDLGDDSSKAESERSEADSDAGFEFDRDSPDVEPAAVTSRWTAAGACCDACGDEVERLWTDGESAICSECKNWE